MFSLIWFSGSSTLLFILHDLFFISVHVPLFSDFIFNDFHVFFYAVEAFTKFIEHPYNHCFELYVVVCLPPFCFILFLEFCSVLSFGTCFFFFLFWQPPGISLNVLGKPDQSPNLVEWLCVVGGF